MHIGLPVGALHWSNFKSPAPNVEVEVGAVAVVDSVPVPVVPAFVLLLVAVASPVGATTSKVVLVPLTVVCTRPAVAVVELLVLEVVVPVFVSYAQLHEVVPRHQAVSRRSTHEASLVSRQECTMLRSMYEAFTYCLSAPPMAQPTPWQRGSGWRSTTERKKHSNA
jgi:hypothetical protein